MNSFSRAGVVVGRPAHQGKAGERNQGIDSTTALALEKLFDGGSCIQAAGKGWNDLQATLLQGRDHRIVMPCIASQQV